MTDVELLAPPDQPLTKHIFYLVYPFRTAVDDFDNLENWKFYTGRLTDDELGREVRDSYTFLPHARQPLYSTLRAHFGDGSASLRRDYQECRGSIRFTLRSVLKSRFAPTSATVFKADGTAVFVNLETGWIDVILYPPGFGFLIYQFHTYNLSVETAGILHRSIKKVLFRERLRVKPPILHGLPGGDADWSDLLSELLADFCVDLDSEYSQIHASSFRVVSMALVAALGDDTLRFGNIHGIEEGHLISLITGEDLSHLSHPGKDLVDAARNSGRLKYWRDWSGVFLWDDVAYIGEETEFTRTSLVHNVEALYVPLFVFTLFQHARLHGISHSLTDLAASESLNHAVFLSKLERLNEDLLRFRSNYVFWEVSRAPVIIALFRHMIESFGTNHLFDQIERDLQRAYLQESKYSQERLARIVGVVTFVTLPISALLGIFNESVRDTLSESWQRWLCLFVVVCTSVVIAFWAIGIPAWIECLFRWLDNHRSEFCRRGWRSVADRFLFGHRP